MAPVGRSGAGSEIEGARATSPGRDPGSVSRPFPAAMRSRSQGIQVAGALRRGALLLAHGLLVHHRHHPGHRLMEKMEFAVDDRPVDPRGLMSQQVH